MIPVLYPADGTIAGFGLGALADCTYCRVVEERNGAYELTLKYPVLGRLYPELKSGCLIKAKPNETSSDQLFRVYKVTTPIQGLVTVYAEHISYDLNAIAEVPWSEPVVSTDQVFYMLLSRTATPCDFAYQTEFETIKAFSVQKPQSVRACIGGTAGSILDVWGGELEWDNKTIIHHKQRGSDTGIIVEYGLNMTNLEHDSSSSDFYTDLFPYANSTDEEGNETLVTLPERLITDGFINVDARRRTLIKDFTDAFEFGTEITADALREKAMQYLDRNPLGTSLPVITVSYEPLRSLPNYPKVLEHISLCDIVTVRHLELGITAKTKVIKTEYDTLAEKYVSVSLGKAKGTLIESMNTLAHETASIIRTIFRIPGFIVPIVHEMGGRIDDIESKRMYRLAISSSNGNVFKNGEISTKLSASVYSWDDDVTEEMDPNQFIWTRVSDDADADAAWNEAHFGGTKEIEITSEDVAHRATFFCDLIDTSTRKSLLGKEDNYEQSTGTNHDH